MLSAIGMADVCPLPLPPVRAHDSSRSGGCGGSVACQAPTTSLPTPILTHPNPLQCDQDAAGRVFMWDRAGNIYYDTEDPRTGMYIVSSWGLNVQSAAGLLACAGMPRFWLGTVGTAAHRKQKGWRPAQLCIQVVLSTARLCLLATRAVSACSHSCRWTPLETWSTCLWIRTERQAHSLGLCSCWLGRATGRLP